MMAYGLSLIDGIGMGAVSLLSAFTVMFYGAPFVLTRFDGRMTEAMLPATALEKFLFLGLYFFIGIPLLVFGVEFLLAYAMLLVNPGYDILSAAMVTYESYTNIEYLWWHSSEDVLVMTFCLWSVCYFKHNRGLKAILTGGAVFVAYGVVAMLYGVMLAVKTGYEAGIADLNEEQSRQVFTEFTASITGHLSSMIIVMDIVSAVVMLFMLWRIYICIKKYQA